MTIKLTQRHYCHNGGILPFLIETVFSIREACRSILGNDLLQRSYSLLMSGEFDLPADAKLFGCSIAHVSTFWEPEGRLEAEPVFAERIVPKSSAAWGCGNGGGDVAVVVVLPPSPPSCMLSLFSGE